MKVAVGAMSHETNTFAAGTTDIDAFATAVGDGILETDRVGRSIGGIVETLDDAGVEVFPTAGASALPGPVVEPETYRWLKGELLDRLAGESVDGVCLDLHGSMFVADEPDPEGDLLAAVRDAVGPDTPITAALDMHATVTEQMVESLDGVAGYRTAPHTDVAETGVRAATLLLDALNGDASLTLGWEPFPMLLAGEQSETEAEPMRTLVESLENADERDGVYDANYFLGFPWADSPHAGCHALVTGDAGARSVVEGTAAELADAFWDRRAEFGFTTEACDPEGALEAAAATDGRPVVVADTGDIPGAGAGENTTNLLSAMLSREDLGTPFVAVVADAESYEACREAGEGTEVNLSLGREYPSGRPLEVAGVPVRFLDADGARTVLVSLDGADVVVADRRTNAHRDPEFVRRLGVDPTERAVIALKSGYLSPAWKGVAARRLFALTPGETNQRLADLPYEHVPRPTYPLDEDAEWSPQVVRRE